VSTAARDGDVLGSEPDVADRGAQPSGRGARGKLFLDQQLAQDTDVEVAGFGSGQGEVGAAAERRFPDGRLVDAEVAQRPGGVVVQGAAQRCRHGAGEGPVAGTIAGFTAGERVTGAVEVCPGQQLGQVTLGVDVPDDGAVAVVGVAGVGAGLVAQVPPLGASQYRRGDEIASPLVVDRLPSRSR
jgi:hypothetical protein